MPKGSPIFNPDVQSDIDMKNTYKLVNWNQGSTTVLSINKTIYVDPVNGTSGGVRGTTAAYQTLTQGLAVAQAGDIIEMRPASYSVSVLHTVSVANLTIRGNGAKLVYASDAGAISIVASGVHVFDLEIDCSVNTGTTNNGVIEVTGDNCALERVYVHNSGRIGIRLLTSFSNTRIIECRLENNYIGLATSIGANISNILVQSCLVTGNRQGGIHINNEQLGTYTLSRVRILGNNLVTNQTGADCENLRLWGGDDDFVVANNYVSENAFGISLDHCRRGVCNSNTVKGGTTVGIELAGCQDVVVVGNYVDGRNEAGSSVGGSGITASNHYATSSDTGPFVISNNLITNIASGPSISIQEANDVLVIGNSSRDNTTNFGGLLIKESFRVRAIGNSFVTTCNTNGPHTLDAGARTVGGQGLQDIELLDNIFDNTGGTQIVTIVDSGGKGVNRVSVTGNIVPAGGTFSAGYLNDLASTVGLVQERNLPQATATNNQSGWHNVQSIERVSYPGSGSFSTTSAGATFESSGRTKIGFDDAGAIGSLRYNIYDSTSTRGHIFSCGVPGSTTDLLSIFGNGVVKAGTNVVETQNNKGAVSGYASLDGSGKVPAAQLPTLSAGTIASTSAVLKGDGSGNAIASTPTGTGDNVLATNPTLITPTIGVATATSVNKWAFTAPSTAATVTAGADNLTYSMPEITTLIGFRHIPQNSQSSPYTAVLADSGKEIYHPVGDNNARTFTIPANASVAYPIGTVILFTNMAPASLSVAITSDTMTLLGSGLTGTRTVAQYGSMAARKDTSTSWIATPIANTT